MLVGAFTYRFVFVVLKMDLRNRICNLCLIKCENYKSIEGNMKTALNILLPTIEFTVIREPVMCKNCEEMLWKYVAFKEKCLNSHNDSVPLCKKDAMELDLNDVCLRKSTTGVGVPENHEVCGFCMNLVKICNALPPEVDKGRVCKKDAMELDLNDVCLRKNTTGVGVPENHEVCGFCMNLVKICNALPPEVDKGRVILKNMIERCLPELDLSVIKNPVICADCHRSLENCFRFVTNCLAVEEKIKKYFENFDVNSKGQIDLNNLLQSVMRTVEGSDIDGNIVDIIKAEKLSCTKIENPEEREIDTIKLEQMSCDDNVGNKNERMSDYAKGNMLDTIKTEETFCAESKTNLEDDDSEIYNPICILKEEVEIKTDDYDFDRYKESIVKTQRKVNSRQKCLTSKSKNELKIPHIKQSLLKNQAKIHKGSSKVALFKCDFCPFQTRWKPYLNSVHMLKHMDPSDNEMFKCDSCPFKTRRKDTLKSHALMHMNPSEITMFKCASCSFQTKRKRTLKFHMLKHMLPSEVTMFTCTSCPFQTKRKHALKDHALKHLEPSEVTMFTCDFCPYQTRWKVNFKSHVLRHMDPSQVTILKCDYCPFQTRQKDMLKRHVLKHMDPSEITMFNCDFCSFQSRRKDKLKSHLLKHMDPSEVTVFTCDFCSYQSKYKHVLKRHMKTHKGTTEVTMLKCNFCSFQSEYNSILNIHLITHENLSK